MLPLHIGIVGCSAEGAALSFAEYVACRDRGDFDGVAELMLRSADRLAAAGADFLVCPDNTIHQALDRVLPRSALPWLHIAEVVAEQARERDFRRVGLTGTTWLVSSDVYPTALASQGIECVRPTDAERDQIGLMIMDELVRGVFKPEAAACFQHVIAGPAARGCEAVVLGCTDAT